MDYIPVLERSTSLQHQIIDINTNERVLGVLWNVLDDTFGFNITLPDKPVTRRGILSTLSRLYDPLRFAAPIVLKPKLLLQSLCKAGLTWDEKLAPEQVTEWQTWLDNLVFFNDVYVQRCFKPAEFVLLLPTKFIILPTPQPKRTELVLIYD